MNQIRILNNDFFPQYPRDTVLRNSRSDREYSDIKYVPFSARCTIGKRTASTIPIYILSDGKAAVQKGELGDGSPCYVHNLGQCGGPDKVRIPNFFSDPVTEWPPEALVVEHPKYGAGCFMWDWKTKRVQLEPGTLIRFEARITSISHIFQNHGNL